MREAVIVSTARTPIGKAYRGAFNATPAPSLGAYAIKAAVERAKVDPAEIDDVVMGAALQQGTSFMNIARTALVRAGLPVTVSGQSVDRQCASGLMAISIAAKEIISDGMTVAIGAGLDSISTNQTERAFSVPDPWLVANKPDIYMSMLETAEIVSARYGISREAQDEYSLQSQQRTAAAQKAGRFNDEIVPVTAVMKVMDKATKQVSDQEITLSQDEGNRPSTTLEGLQSLEPVFKNGQKIKEGKFITAGNASQLSDGASASVLMEAKEAERRGLPVASKPDSYDICFVADGDTRGFLQRCLGVQEGAMVSPDGEVLGTHGGYFGFTVGQRKGLGLTHPAPDGRPRYVIETRPETNEVVVGPEELLSRTTVDASSLVLLAEPGDVDGTTGWPDVTVQVRAHGRPVPAQVSVDVTAGTLHADLRQPLRGLAAGQSVVVYGGESGEQVLAQATVA